MKIETQGLNPETRKGMVLRRENGERYVITDIDVNTGTLTVRPWRWYDAARSWFVSRVFRFGKFIKAMRRRNGNGA